MSAPLVPPPDPRALLAVLEARRRSDSASRADLTSSALALARDQEVPELDVRRAADAYSDAVDGFTKPNGTWGYVGAALYALRRKIARWLGIPFVLLLVLVGFGWGYSAVGQARRLENLRVDARTQLRAAHQRLDDAAGLHAELDRLVRAERPAPPNLTALFGRLAELQGRKNDLASRIDRMESQTPRDERGLRRLRADARAAADETADFERDLNDTRELFLKGRELLRLRGRLEHVMAEAQALGPSSPTAAAEALYQRGIAALGRSDAEGASERLAELVSWVKLERDSAMIPGNLNELLAQVKDLTTDAEALSRAAALHRQGRWAFDRSERLQAQESVLLLKSLIDDLTEEYTLIITGGKWRFKNGDPSIRNYYVIVEAVDPRGDRLSRRIENEEDGRASTVRQWGERVPFAIYERVRKDKQDNGRIDQNVFGRKLRGRLDVVVELRTDEGELLPRSGQITRW
jgi:hypothetical protein